MRPFWETSGAQATANEQAEMAAFCAAYRQTAAAVVWPPAPPTATLAVSVPCALDAPVMHVMLITRSRCILQA